MASIQRRGKCWRVRVRYQGYPLQSRSFDARAEALAWARQTEADMDRGTFISLEKATRTTLDELLERYAREVSPIHKGVVAEQLRLAALRRHLIAQRKVATLRSHDFANWRNERLKRVAPTTVTRELNLLHHIFEIARKEWGIHVPNPVSDVSRPKAPPGRDRRLQPGEEERLLAALQAVERDEHGRYISSTRNAWVLPLVMLAIETAMRRGELLSLRWEHVDLARRTAHLPDTKNGEPRTVPLSSRAVAVLTSLARSIDGRVFPLSTESAKKVWQRARQRAALTDLRFHDLRHEATSRLFERGLDIMEVASITGHKDLRMLRRYTHLRAEDLARKLG